MRCSPSEAAEIMEQASKQISSVDQAGMLTMDDAERYIKYLKSDNLDDFTKADLANILEIEAKMRENNISLSDLKELLSNKNIAGKTELSIEGLKEKLYEKWVRENEIKSIDERESFEEYIERIVKSDKEIKINPEIEVEVNKGGTGHGYSVDPTMFPDDEAAGVLRNGEYVKNPTAHSINDYISEGSNYLGSKNMNGQYMYVVDMDGNIIIGTRGGQRMPHPTLVGGSNPQVQAAGIVEIRSGKIYSINNASGHFKPGVESLEVAEDAFSNLPQNIFSKDFQGYLPYGD